MTVFIFLTGTDVLGPYFNSKLLAITHLAVLGWASMLAFGALYQLIPVVFETALYSELLAKITFWIFAIAIFLLVYAFWTSAFGTTLLYASSLMFIALFGFIGNVLLSQRRGKQNIQSRYVVTAILWLLLTALFGLLIAINFRYPFLSQIHLHYLKIHAHLGLVGWFVILIVGVSSSLIPMFLISHSPNEDKLNYAYYLINGGLLLLGLDWLVLQGTMLIPVYWLSISLGIIFYLMFVWEVYKKRLRKELDIGMKHTLISVLSMLLPILLSLTVMLKLDFENSFQLRATTLYGFSIIFGLITPIILSQTYKTLPFIVWLHKYKQLVGKFKTPLPKELYSEWVATLQFYSYNLAVIVLILAITSNNIWMIRLGSCFLLITAVLYNLNVFKIIFHKVKTESIST
ncbi:MAG: cytochrome C oxidase subunit I [Candidatus Marinimicrobia bacterium]|nr:cytochrome C oxidase subunit I [Candidatus Neomarinimicrobiota bacterium]